MTKRRSINLFIVFSVILVILLVACFVNFTLPFPINGKYYSYSNFVSNIKLGEDLGNSLRVVYKATASEDENATNYENLRKSTIKSLKSIVQAEGYQDVSAVEYGTDSICLTIGGILTEKEEDSLTNLIGSPKAISFSTNSDGSSPFLKGESVKQVTTGQQTYEGELYFYVNIEFKDEYKNTARENANGKTVYIYLGEQKFTEWTNGIEDGYIQLYSSTFESINDANTCANQIRTGLLPLELQCTDIGNITPTYGVITRNNQNFSMLSNVLLIIVFALFVIGILVYLIVKYKQMGWVMSFNLLFYIVLSLFLIQAIPLAHVNFAGAFGMMLAFTLTVLPLVSILETAKKYYNEDVKLHVALKVAVKDNTIQISLTTALMFIAGAICVFMPSLSVKSFGWVMLLTSMVTFLTTLAMSRLFVNMYLAFNNSDGKKCNFHKGEKNA